MTEFEEFQRDFHQHYVAMRSFLQQAEAEAHKSDNKKLVQLIKDERNRITLELNALTEKSKELYPFVKKVVDKRTSHLEKQIEVLNKTKDILISDNYLLEYKKKDLLQLTSKLEEAYEEISAKNKELILHQEKISEQAEKLNEIHREILGKNHELEQQKEELLDQSDYLHEANQTITQMHEEVQNQKNEILKKNEELLNLNNEKNNLIGIVAHDLKSPLNQMKGLLGIIKMTTNLDGEVLQYINMMEQSTSRLTEMIGKILDVEAIESSQLNLTLEKINLTEILKSLVERFTLSAKEKNMQILCSIDEGVQVMADRVCTEQVFENLLSNAVKFSPPKKKIYVNLKSSNNRAVGEVKDEGPGINDEDKKKLFGKYQKLSARPTGNETSTGLGLSIVKKFVEAMHGEIWCESAPGQGASFMVALPLQ